MALTLTSVFADLPDPRTETANKIHTLTDILTIATCAVIAGAEGWEDIARYGRSKEAFFRQFIELKNGVPSHDTFHRVGTNRPCGTRSPGCSTGRPSRSSSGATGTPRSGTPTGGTRSGA
ncbi:MAG: transposase family protein [Planctomycetes bacterium]|nr:transposase family protein [Planctomycetota bacterium]